MPESYTIQLTILRHSSQEALPEADRALLDAAYAAARGAYAPYSRFQVGAALRLASGVVVIGSNQENASYPVGICAERTALHAAMAQWPDASVEAMAVVVPSVAGDRPVSPCGICRQALLEQEQRQRGPMRLLMAVPGGPVHELANASALLPLSFDGSFLKS